MGILKKLEWCLGCNSEKENCNYHPEEKRMLCKKCYAYAEKMRIPNREKKKLQQLEYERQLRLQYRLSV